MMPEDSKDLLRKFSSQWTELNKLTQQIKKDRDGVPWYKKVATYLWSFSTAFIIVLPIIILFSVYGIWAYGFAMTKLWLWFIVPIFHIQPITILQAAGIMCVVRLITAEHPPENGEDKPTSYKVERVLMVVIYPWATLVIGYAIHYLMPVIK